MKYRRKPVVVDAIQWDGSYASYAQIARELLGRGYAGIHHHPPTGNAAPYLTVMTLNGPTTAEAGDWIIQGTRPGDVYPCKHLQFCDVYEEAL